MLTLSHQKEPNGTTAMGMVTVIILHQRSNLTNVPMTGATALKTDSDVQIPMAMDGQTLPTGLLPTKSNGSMLTMTDTVTTISTMSPRINFTSTNVEMHSLPTQPNGTIPMETVTVTTTRMFHGINTEARNGLVKSSSALRTSTYFHSTEHSGEIRTEIGLATSK